MQTIGLEKVRPAMLVIAPVAVLTLISATILAMLLNRAGAINRNTTKKRIGDRHGHVG